MTRLSQSLAILSGLLGACGESLPERCQGVPFGCPEEWLTGPVRPSGAPFAAHDDVVSDLTTGLMWQRLAPERMYRWQAALEYCEDLELADHDDWRLPNRLELVMLIDYPSAQRPVDDSEMDGTTAPRPIVDTTAFPGTAPSLFWTASNFVEDDTYFTTAQPGDDVAWTVDFSTGLLERQHVDLLLPRTRCVRTERASSGEGERYAVTQSTVTEAATGLVWERAVVQRGLSDAEAHCASLSAPGVGRFRLPTVKEALSIVSAVAPGEPFVDPDAFELPTGFFYADLWTSTPWTLPTDVAGPHSGDRLMVVDFRHRGRLTVRSTLFLGKPITEMTLCVGDARGSSAPRALEDEL